MAPACPQKGVHAKGQSVGKGGKNGASACVSVMAGKREEEDFEHYTREGHVVVGDGEVRVPVRIMRDSGTKYSLMVSSLLPKVDRKGVMRMKGVGGMVEAPMVDVVIEAEGWRKKERVALTPELPMKGVDVLLGNNAGGEMKITRFLGESAERVEEPVASFQKTDVSVVREAMMRSKDEQKTEERPEEVVVTRKEQRELQQVYLGEMGRYFSDEQAGDERRMLEGASAAVTRAMARREQEAQHEEEMEGIRELFGGPGRQELPSQEEEEVKRDPSGGEMQAEREQEGDESGAMVVAAPRCEGEATGLPCSREKLILAQREDPQLTPLWERALTEEEAEKEATCYYKAGGLLKRKWSPRKTREEQQPIHQVVIPRRYREEVIRIAHEETVAHLSARKTGDAITCYFFLDRAEEGCE